MAYPDEWNDVLKERDQLKAENERLREALQEIANHKDGWLAYPIDDLRMMRLKAQQALNEVKE